MSDQIQDRYDAAHADDHFARGMEQLHAGIFGGGKFISLLVQLGGTPAVASLIQLLLSKLGGGTATPTTPPTAPAGAQAMTFPPALIDLANRIIAIGKPFALQFVKALVQELLVQLQGSGGTPGTAGTPDTATVPTE